MARTQKLKVFRTPIGFHDAYVAAPSQKAALAAWGSHADLFARGVAEVVTDAELMREPLSRPGEVIRRIRGSEADHLAATSPPPHRTPAHRAGKAGRKPAKKVSPRPSRDKLDAAEQALRDLRERQQREAEQLRAREAEIERQRREIERERRELERSHDRALRAAEAALTSERTRHADALDRWLAEQE